MSCMVECPYPTKFSFSKLIEELRRRNTEVNSGGLIETINYLEAIEDSLHDGRTTWAELTESEAFPPLIKQVLPSFFLCGLSLVREKKSYFGAFWS